MIIVTIIGVAAAMQLILVSAFTYPMMSIVGILLLALNAANLVREIKKESSKKGSKQK